MLKKSARRNIFELMNKKIKGLRIMLLIFLFSCVRICLLGNIPYVLARDIVDRGIALERIDEYIKEARDNLNNPSGLYTSLETYLAEVWDHPKVYGVLEYVITKSTNPGCVSLALKRLAYFYYGTGPSHDETRRKNTLRLLKHALKNKSLWVRMRACGILMDHRLKDLKGRNLAYPVLLNLASIKEWESKLEQELPSTFRSEGYGDVSLEEFKSRKATYWMILLNDLLEFNTPESQRAIQQALEDTSILSYILWETEFEKNPSNREWNKRLLKKLQYYTKEKLLNQ